MALYYGYAYFLAQHDRIEEALTHYRKILREQPDAYNALRQAGFLCYNEAIKVYHFYKKLQDGQKQLEESIGLYSPLLCYLRYGGGMKHGPRGDQMFKVGGKKVRSISVENGKHGLWDGFYKYFDNPLYASKSNVQPLIALEPSVIYEGMPLQLVPFFQEEAKFYVYILNKIVQEKCTFQQYLQYAASYLQKARKADRNDLPAAGALYYSYLTLGKHGSASRLWRKICFQRKAMESNPFVVEPVQPAFSVEQ